VTVSLNVRTRTEQQKGATKKRGERRRWSLSWKESAIERNLGLSDQCGRLGTTRYTVEKELKKGKTSHSVPYQPGWRRDVATIDSSLGGRAE